MRAERVDVGAIGRTQGSLISAWLDLPVKRPVVLVLVVLIVAAPACLLADWLKNLALHPTDFIYIEEAIDARALRKHLFVPLNTHVVPLFRLYTYAVVQSTDRLEDLPRMLLGASYLGLVATMLLVGRLVRQETERTGPALGAMACMGITTVVLPVVSHYAASQALWSGAAIVATLLGDPCLAVQGWNLETGAGRDRSLRRAGNLVGRTGCWSSRRGSALGRRPAAMPAGSRRHDRALERCRTRHPGAEQAIYQRRRGRQ